MKKKVQSGELDRGRESLSRKHGLEAIAATQELYSEGGNCEEQLQIEKKKELSERWERKLDFRLRRG